MRGGTVRRLRWRVRGPALLESLWRRVLAPTVKGLLAYPRMLGTTHSQRPRLLEDSHFLLSGECQTHKQLRIIKRKGLIVDSL